MPHMNRAAEFDLAQCQCQWHGGKRDQHQHPEGIHVAEERCLRLDLLPDPGNCLVLRLDQ